MEEDIGHGSRVDEKQLIHYRHNHSPTIDSLNNLFATTKIPPRIYTTVAKRKYPPIEKEKKMARINGT